MDPREEILNQQRRRYQGLLRQEERDKRQTRSTYYAGQDVNGLPLVRSLGGAAVPMRSLSNVQPDVGQQGRSDGRGFDIGNRRQPDPKKSRRIAQNLFPKQLLLVSNGNLQKLFVRNTLQYVQLGTVGVDPLTDHYGNILISYSLTSTGPNINDFIVTAQFDSNKIIRFDGPNQHNSFYSLKGTATLSKMGFFTDRASAPPLGSIFGGFNPANDIFYMCPRDSFGEPTVNVNPGALAGDDLSDPKYFTTKIFARTGTFAFSAISDVSGFGSSTEEFSIKYKIQMAQASGVQPMVAPANHPDFPAGANYGEVFIENGNLYTIPNFLIWEHSGDGGNTYRWEFPLDVTAGYPATNLSGGFTQSFSVPVFNDNYAFDWGIPTFPVIATQEGGEPLNFYDSPDPTSYLLFENRIRGAWIQPGLPNPPITDPEPTYAYYRYEVKPKLIKGPASNSYNTQSRNRYFGNNSVLEFNYGITSTGYRNENGVGGASGASSYSERLIYNELGDYKLNSQTGTESSTTILVNYSLLLRDNSAFGTPIYSILENRISNKYEFLKAGLTVKTLDLPLYITSEADDIQAFYPQSSSIANEKYFLLLPSISNLDQLNLQDWDILDAFTATSKKTKIKMANIPELDVIQNDDQGGWVNSLGDFVGFLAADLGPGTTLQITVPEGEEDPYDGGGGGSY